MQAEELLRNGQLDEALAALQDRVRKNPGDAKLRVFLFQLLCVRGDWDRAMTQLNVAAELDAANLLMAQVCRPALQCEALRADIFAGKKAPLVFGQPQEWVGWMVTAHQLVAEGKYSAAAKLRLKALEAAPAIGGAIDDKPFEWIADADGRLGPLLEAVVEGRYYWVPFANVRQLVIEPPADLRDVVWSPAHLTWANGGESVGLIPTRYAGSQASDDDAIRMARRTDWVEHKGELYVGLGQRMFATDQGEYPLLETRKIVLNAPKT